jgi:CheY-specific phosphatase CheX
MAATIGNMSTPSPSANPGHASGAPDAARPATVFDRVIETSVIDCLSARGLSARPAQPHQPPNPYENGAIVTFVGLFGEKITGTLLFAVHPDLAAKLALAANPSGVTQAAHLDGMAELTNELLGRIKNRLVPHGITFQLGLPKALACAGFWLHTIPGETHRAHRFASEEGDVWAWFDVVLAPGFSMLPPRDESANCVPEGELLML